MQSLVQSQNAVLDIQQARDLRIEAETIEATHGPNAYSEYLRRHGRRPDRKTAADIGRLLGGRVKADDGSIQPPLSAADRAAKADRKAFARRYEQIMRIKFAISALADNQDDPAKVIGDGVFLLESPEMVAQLESAVFWLTRFAECWHGQAQSAQKQGAHYRDKSQTRT